MRHTPHAAVAAALLAALLGAGCATKQPEAEAAAAKPAEPETPERPAHKGPVCLMERWLPTGMKYEEIHDIDVKKTWYGTTDAMLAPLADEAREVGANVVMRMRVGMSMGAIAWARPYAEGKAVWAPDMTDDLCEKLKGQLL
jgi:hypothetical protein